MTEILQYISDGHWFLWIAIGAAILCLILMKGRRVSFVIPVILMGILLANPLFHILWEKKLGQNYYWRVLWIVPIIPLCAALPALIAEKVKNSYIKGAIAIVCLAVFALTGTFMYDQEYASFEIPAANNSKLPGEVVDIADYLLSLEETPDVVADLDISMYLRQYDGHFRLLFSRDVDGYIYQAGSEAKKVHKELTKSRGDMSVVAETMLNNGFTYLVTKDEAEFRSQSLADQGFELLNHISDYGIYLVHGNPTLIKERNELGQVISITNVDENGNPVNGKDGYAVTTFDYDANGNIIYEFRTDTEGNGVLNSNGQAGYEREYNGRSQLVMERFLGVDGDPVRNIQNYAEYRREYKGSDLIRESYYDEEGLPINRSDTFYAYKTMRYDGNHNLLRESYYDQDGNPVLSNGGYATVTKEYRNQKMVKQTYYGVDGDPITISKGYAGFTRDYNSKGKITSEAFLDETGASVDQINGYAKEERSYDEKGNLICQKYYNAQGEPVVIYTGYSEVRKTYDFFGRVVKEEYFDESGEPAVQPAGHTAVANQYDQDDNLHVRTYLGADGEPIRRIDGYTEAWWIPDDQNVTNVSFYTESWELVPMDRINLVQDVNVGPDGWSAWMTPTYDKSNATLNIGFVNLGEKQAGDTYTCQIEIEFFGVTAVEGQEFRFCAQGAQDGAWGKGNVWDSKLINLNEVPQDGVYTFTSTREVTEKNVSVSTFNVGFRCDYWASGMFRVRNVKIEKGDVASEWSPGE